MQPRLESVFSARLSKKSFAAIELLAQDIGSYSEDNYDLITYEPLYTLMQSSLELALERARADDSTKPLSAWKRTWCEKRSDGQLTLKDAKRSTRLRNDHHRACGVQHFVCRNRCTRTPCKYESAA